VSLSVTRRNQELRLRTFFAISSGGLAPLRKSNPLSDTVLPFAQSGNARDSIEVGLTRRLHVNAGNSRAGENRGQSIDAEIGPRDRAGFNV
jgi:hypothetical protein